jgi:hypothetical protein
MTLVNGYLTFVMPLVTPAYVWFATIETVCTSVIIWKAWKWTTGARCAEIPSG